MKYINKFLGLIFLLACANNSFAMRVAVLAWGSLVERPGDLALEEANGFQTNGQTGPGLRIDYARRSQDGRLTLVIAPGLNANEMQTFYATYRGNDLNNAIAALRAREGTTAENIGYVNVRDQRYRRKDFNSEIGVAEVRQGGFADQYYRANAMLGRITAWARANNYNAVIWTDLPPTFTRNQFTLRNLQAHLNGLDQGSLRKSYCYFKITPPAIRNATRFGNQLMEHAANRMQNNFNVNVRGLTTQQCIGIIWP